MTPDKQLEEWVKGNSLCPNDRGECCPDFSCCTPSLLADEDARIAFSNASDEERMSFFGMFLGAAINKMATGKNVYIAGVDDLEATIQ